MVLLWCLAFDFNRHYVFLFVDAAYDEIASTTLTQAAMEVAAEA